MRARAATAAARRHSSAPAPRAPRRVSGPRPLRAAAVPAPHVGRLRALPDHRLLDRLLRSRAWICVMGIALGGIVAMQVSLLKLNTGISRAVETSATLERANAQLEEEVATLSTGERVRGAAVRLGMLMPEAGTVGYMTARPGFDESRALRRMTPPSDDARELLANGGRSTTLAPATTALTTAPAATTTDPAAMATPVPTATATPPAATQQQQPQEPSAQPAPSQSGATGAVAAPTE